MTRSSLLATSRCLYTGLVLGMSVLCSSVCATAKSVYSFNIPSQALADALADFSRISNYQFFYTDPKIASIKVEGVIGRYSPNKALSKLLLFTNVKFKYTNANMVLLYLPAQENNNKHNKAQKKQGDYYDESLYVDEVVVFARKVEENLQQTPVAISAFSGAELEANASLDLLDVSLTAPNVNFGNGATFSGLSSAPTTYIRGIGQNDFIIAADPAVGVYLDGVYIARSIGSLVDLLDLKRIEILRGPQGTVFGRNSIGGAINVISHKPNEDYTGQLALVFGQDRHRELRLTANAPLNHWLQARVSALYRKRDGYVEATQYNNLQLGDDNVLAARAQLRMLLSEQLTLDFALDYNHEREAPAALVARDLEEQGLATPELLTEADFFNRNISTNSRCITAVERNSSLACYGNVYLSSKYQSHSVWTDEQGRLINPKNTLKVNGMSATVNWQLEHGVLKSITAYRELASEFFNDLDFSPHVVFHNINSPFNQRQFSEEIQFTSSWMNERLNSVLGLYYFEEKGIEVVKVVRAQSAFDIAANTREIDNTSSALYGQLTWSLNEQLHLTAGLRYTNDSKNYLTSVVFRDDQNPLGPVSGHQSTTEWTPLLTLAYDLTQEHHLYMTYTKGFRDGGFPARFTDGLPDSLPVFNPEYVTSLELGFKSTWLDNRLRLNIAIFHTDYQDFQISTTVVVNNDLNTQTDNLAQVQYQGLELELNALLFNNLRFDISMGYLDDQINGATDQRDISTQVSITRDTDLPYTPTWNASIAGTYQFPTDDNSQWLARLVWYYVDEQFYSITNTPGTAEQAYNHADANITYYHRNRHWQLSLGIRNITNAVYATTANVSAVIGNTFANVSRPRDMYIAFKYYL